ncbi:glucokinase [Spiribacter curvatus]|uniref:glucokinase n=1 Tax=Spiribacter curvatus TaxID=1335757 RepID=UPI000977351A|nr:glucokinase [Spiribacter curvatus]
MSTTHPDSTLVADVGGTHARAGVVTRPGEPPAQIFKRRTGDFDGLEAFLDAALAALSEAPRPNRVLCAVASPLDHDPIELTNAGWRFSPAAVARHLRLEQVRCLNDWVAQGWAVTRLRSDDRRCIYPGISDPEAPRLALGPGTGLGSALITPIAGGWQVYATEGGHISFAAHDAREWAIAEHIEQRFGHCSAERLASGIGIEAIDRALHAIAGTSPVHTSAEAIARDAMAGDRHCREVLGHMTDALGSAAGDLALATGARGGIYFGGGIIPALGDCFDWERLHRRFVAKGRFEDYLAAIPIHTITHPAPALMGLSAYLLANRPM